MDYLVDSIDLCFYLYINNTWLIIVALQEILKLDYDRQTLLCIFEVV